MNNQAVIVIRSSGERTLEVCEKLLQSQSKDFKIHIIEEQPFDAALLSCYKIGISSGADWLITVDADMLLIDGSIETLLLEAEAMPDNYFHLQGTIFDNITGTIRWAGPRIYRTTYLGKAITFLESSESRIRPEYSTIQFMIQCGYPSRSISQTLCLHDYDQFYKDLYRKAYIHAIKHEELLIELIRRCKLLMDTNPDFRVILKGLVDGVGSTDAVSIDTRLFHKKAEVALSELNLEEKSSIHHSVSEQAKKEFNAVRGMEYTQRYQDYISNTDKRDSLWGNLKLVLSKKGIIRGVLFLVGASMAKMGERIKSLSN
jgi:glycosyltransferase involved in cell wall biosynthesis